MRKEQAIEKARKLSIDMDSKAWVIEIDHEEDTDYMVTAKEDFLYSNEFYYFNGNIVKEFYRGA